MFLDACGPGGTSGASFPDPEVCCSALGNAEKLDVAWTFKAPEEEERRPPPPPQNQTTMEEPIATLGKKKTTPQPSLRRDRQEAAGC
ncbi:hypothetical protein NDU88_000450 [Pleurodeles waltl]|uniref:Uncharacterized protein n=1 Tax=Pleurodeles waltl TaxID=8319 RepID=A0AAV7UQ00_PLEWA|nr:hypothetical protein NDU88_000450 [Pleurodeles waltl]